MKKALLILMVLALVLPAMGTETEQRLISGNRMVTFDPGETVQLTVNHTNADAFSSDSVIFSDVSGNLFGSITIDYFYASVENVNLTETLIIGMEKAGGHYSGTKSFSSSSYKEYAVVNGILLYQGVPRNVTEMMVLLDEKTLMHIIVDEEHFDRIVGTIKATGLVLVAEDYFVMWDAGPGAKMVKNGTFNDNGTIVRAVKFINNEGVIGTIDVGRYGPINCTAKNIKMMSRYKEYTLLPKTFHGQKVVAVTAFDSAETIKQNITSVMVPLDEKNVLGVIVTSPDFDKICDSIDYTRRL